MTNSIRCCAPNVAPHVTARVNWGFWHLNTRERSQFFMDTLATTLEQYALELLAIVLMSNHFHAIMQCPDEQRYRELTGRRTKCRHFRPWPPNHPNATVLGQAMRRFMYLVSREVHRQLEVTGRFWEKSYHMREIVDATDLVVTIAYDHRNPVRAGMVLGPEDHAWSSAAWWAGVGDSPVPIAAHGRVPFGLTVEELREAVLCYQKCRALADVLEAMGKKGVFWDDLDQHTRQALLRDLGLPPVECGTAAAPRRH